MKGVCSNMQTKITINRRLVAAILGIIMILSTAVVFTTTAYAAATSTITGETFVRTPDGQVSYPEWTFGKRVQYGSAYCGKNVQYKEDNRSCISEPIWFENGNKNVNVSVRAYKGPKDPLPYTEFRIIFIDDLGKALGWTCAVRSTKGEINIDSSLTFNGNKRDAKGFIISLTLCSRAENAEEAFKAITGTKTGNDLIPDTGEWLFAKKSNVTSSRFERAYSVRINGINGINNIDFVETNEPIGEYQWVAFTDNVTIYFLADRIPAITDQDKALYDKLVSAFPEMKLPGFPGKDEVIVNKVILVSQGKTYIAENLSLPLEIERLDLSA